MKSSPRDTGPGGHRHLRQYCRPVVVSVACCLSALTTLSCSRTSTPPGPSRKGGRDTLLLVVDALRADRLGFMGAANNVSPNIDALAADGTRFDRAIAQSTFTGCSIASLFTALNPHRHGLYWGSLSRNDAISAHVLASDHYTLAEWLSSRNHATAAWFQNRMLRQELGFDQGFGLYREIRGDKGDGSRRIFDRYLEWLAERDDNRPSFAYLHLLDLHDPYNPPAPFDTTFMTPDAEAPAIDPTDQRAWRRWLGEVKRGERRVSAGELAWILARYDGAVASIDRQLGRLVAALADMDRYDDMTIVLTADHGDGFAEHGFLSHTNLPYGELVHVPLIVKLPGGRGAGRTVKHQVRLIDVAPTLVELSGGGEASWPVEIDGCSLLPLLASGDSDPRPSHCREAVSEILLGGERLGVAVRQDGMSYLLGDDMAPELYDLAADPHEQTNLAGRGLEVEARLHERALEVLAAARTVQAERRVLDEETTQEVRALGYIE